MNKYIFFVLLLILQNSANAEEYVAKSYVDDSRGFLYIEDPNRQAEAWAMCAASYDLMAEILAKSHPARSQQLAELANGAELAVILSMVVSEINEKTTPEKFDAVWNFSKIFGGELPKTRRTVLLADLESAKSAGAAVFISDISKTLEVCMANLSAQQTYIDIWRKLATSGLLQLPSE